MDVVFLPLFPHLLLAASLRVSSVTPLSQPQHQQGGLCLVLLFSSPHGPAVLAGQQSREGSGEDAPGLWNTRPHLPSPTSMSGSCLTQALPSGLLHPPLFLLSVLPTVLQQVLSSLCEIPSMVTLPPDWLWIEPP